MTLISPICILEAQSGLMEVKDELEAYEDTLSPDSNILPIVDSLIAECQVAIEAMEEKLEPMVSARPFQ